MSFFKTAGKFMGGLPGIASGGSPIGGLFGGGGGKNLDLMRILQGIGGAQGMAGGNYGQMLGLLSMFGPQAKKKKQQGQQDLSGGGFGPFGGGVY